MKAITVNPDTYTRKNNDAAIAGAVVGMMHSLMLLKYQDVIEKHGLVEHYNFVGIPDTVWCFDHLFMPICKALDITPDYFSTLVQIKDYNDPE